MGSVCLFVCIILLGDGSRFSDGLRSTALIRLCFVPRKMACACLVYFCQIKAIKLWHHLHMCAVVLWTKIVLELVYVSVGWTGEERQTEIQFDAGRCQWLNVSASENLLWEIVCRSGFANIVFLAWIDNQRQKGELVQSLVAISTWAIQSRKTQQRIC